MALFGLSISGIILGILAILFGIFVLVMPKLLRWLVGLYFIIAGVISIIGAL